ncbi:hypothetical protein [Actinosynnema sp. ALI-1.44]|nr:hypothetical protein [Actinosynnema sp. ALI-1.44]
MSGLGQAIGQFAQLLGRTLGQSDAEAVLDHAHCRVNVGVYPERQ